jgi:hypothetical protein
MSIFGKILSSIVIFIVTFIVVSYILYYTSGNKYLLPQKIPLSGKKDILFPDETQKLLLGSPGSTVMGFFKLESGDRTINSTNQFVPLMQVDNNWFLEVSPAPANNSNISARLRVKTNNAGTLTNEFVNLPAIPKQKWVFIAILRDARRFDVIYDNQIVASHRLKNYPAVISSPLSVGNKGLAGSVIYVTVNGTRQTPSEVEKERVSKIDTANTVIEKPSFDITLPKLSLFNKCPPGLPCNPVTSPPSNHLFQWKSPYA